MPPLNARKTLLALLIGASPLPSLAETIQLTDAGHAEQNQSHPADLEFTGSYTGLRRDAINLANTRVMGDLVFNSAINDNDQRTVDMVNRSDGIRLANSSIGGYLYNRGNVKTTSLDGAALRLQGTLVDGDLTNEGSLRVGTGISYFNGGPTYGIDLSSPSGATVLHGDVINADGASITVEGRDARGINLAGASLEGKVVNRGNIDVSGPGAVAISATAGTSNRPTILAGIENTGRIFASDQAIALDGATLVDSMDRHLVNSGRITATTTAIRIGNTAFDDTGLSAWYKANGALNIFNSGTIWGNTAIDATASNRPVELILRQGSKVYGDLVGLANIEVEGDSTYGVAYGPPGSNSIRLANGGWIDVGDSSEPPTTFTLHSLHTTLDGNLRIADNSALGLWLASSTDPNTAVLKVSGIAEFAQNARILLEPEDTDFEASGSRYLLLEAGQVQVLDAKGLQVNAKPQVASTSAMLNVLSSTLDDNKVYVTVSTKPTEDLEQIVAQQGGDSNAQRALGNLAEAGLLARLGNQDPLFLAAASADEAQLTRLAEQLAPDVSDGARQAALASQRLIGNAIDNRSSSLRAPRADEARRASGVWMQSLYSDASQQQRDGIAGYNAYSRGVAVGADGQLDDQLTLGAAYSFIDTDINGKRGNKTQVQSHAFSLYGSYTLDNYFVDASLTYGFNDNQGKREIAGTRAKSDYDSNLLGLNLVGGYSWQPDPRLLVEPRLAARYSRVDIDSFNEKGSSAALKVEAQRYEAIELGAGVRVASQLPLGAGILEPQLKVMAYHDFAADPVQNTATFVLGTTPFVSHGASVARNSYEAGLGADYKLGAVSVGVSYDYAGKSGFDADVFSARLRYAF
ncbi:autotransporter [Pseudomonas sp. RtIB026]|uniref:autotransporter family protein n=1 Tax=Pseudomonas sp. RtIB026 TaxID=2749999 RepID=UPI001AF49591|nr:autotransporter outer membrane beta-barrel domain-containing protein [Pseudomonas sp. RtIB026]BCJ05894.1 autotransporter [Pseudomonas sp. RtIB026]